jgi:hypothetical protein
MWKNDRCMKVIHFKFFGENCMKIISTGQELNITPVIDKIQDYKRYNM